MSNTAIIYYFTGTGNSKRVADIAAKQFSKLGFTVHLSCIENDRIHALHDSAERIGFIAPVYGFGLPAMMATFLRKLPRGNGQKAFVFIPTGNTEYITLGSRKIAVPPCEGITILQAMFWLRMKGYQFTNAHPIETPNNWILPLNPPQSERLNCIRTNAEKSVENYVQEICHGKRKIAVVNPPLLVLLGFIYLMFIHFGRHAGGKCFAVTEHCNSCKICHVNCPSGTVKWKNGKPYWGWHCQQCFRCINYCPQQAIEVANVALIGSLLLLFLFDFRYSLLPISYMNSLSYMSLPVDVAIRIIAMFAVMWLLEYMQNRWSFGRRFMRWYATKKRIRYREPDFDAKSRNDQ